MIDDLNKIGKLVAEWGDNERNEVDFLSSMGEHGAESSLRLVVSMVAACIGHAMAIKPDLAEKAISVLKVLDGIVKKGEAKPNAHHVAVVTLSAVLEEGIDCFRYVGNRL